MREGRGRRASGTLCLILVAAVIGAGLVAGGLGTASGTPPLPIGVGSRFLGNVSAPTLVAGASGAIRLTVADPLAVSLEAISLRLNVYAFNGFPGNSSVNASTVTAPILSSSTGAGPWANYSWPALGSGATVQVLTSVTTSAATPSGTYAIRTSLEFTTPNGTRYLLESRGWFSAATWSQATELPNGSATLNLSVLGVSGVTPETAILVQSGGLTIVLYVVLGLAIALAGIGGYFYFRRPPSSSSGTR